MIQRVKRASVVVEQQQGEDTTATAAATTPTVVSEIGKGIVCLIGIKDGDEADDALWMCKQITTAKLFEGMSEANADKRWRSNVKQNGFEILLVSQARSTYTHDCCRSQLLVRPAVIGGGSRFQEGAICLLRRE